ncbi:hypothetical protein HYN56_08750 [Flavobacterium crocinum]|uniref:DUF4348 domain-containing protein n=1 Tax=Flavobacterium crocinum TaxID=2183896 RepID=A0A2S1YJS1_9FLAO|nr:hypothetical protein [Flavobacterium crocinum]AWK04320.1 hypothetical protein HYN56_08750 [Flavobacterium crocinum]
MDNMDSIFKKMIFFFFFLTVLSCKNEEKPQIKKIDLVSEGRSLIRQYSNVLIDSVEQFDVRPEHEKNDAPKITIGLIDSIPKRNEKLNLGTTNGHTFVSFKLEKEDLINFKSPYKLNLVKENNNDVNIVFVTILELSINGEKAYVAVKKVRGIGMVEDTYYFKKENGKWIFLRKGLSTIG